MNNPTAVIFVNDHAVELTVCDQQTVLIRRGIRTDYDIIELEPGLYRVYGEHRLITDTPEEPHPRIYTTYTRWDTFRLITFVESFILFRSSDDDQPARM